MTVCNMSIEAGARAGLIAPDQTTFDYIKGRPKAPKGEAWDMALAYWKTLHSDDDAYFDKVVELDAANLPPIVSWGSSPEDVVSVEGVVPNPDEIDDENRREIQEARAGLYGPGPRAPRSPTSRSTGPSSAPAPMAASRTCGPLPPWSAITRSAPHVSAMVVPGSGLVKEQAEEEGLDVIFKEAGFEWREPGCSMCLAMNADKLKPGRALRLDVQPELRGASGPQGPDPPGVAGNGRRRRDRGSFRRHPRLDGKLIRRIFSFEFRAPSGALFHCHRKTVTMTQMAVLIPCK